MTLAGAAPYAIRMAHPQKRMDLSLTPTHAARLLKLAAYAGVTRSEYLRRLIDKAWWDRGLIEALDAAPEPGAPGLAEVGG